jgi:hypothetical protein
VSVSSINSEEEAAGYFVVEEVLEHRWVDGKMELLVSWGGYGSDANSWEPEDNMISMAEHAVDLYWLNVDGVSESEHESESESE